MGEENKRRRLRLSNEDTGVSEIAKLYNFDDSNDLLYKDQKILLDTVTDVKKLSKYKYFKERSQLPRIPKRSLQMETLPIILSRRRKHKVDPLSDDAYVVFHRRMMKDERSCTAADKSRIVFEMDNLRAQYELLQQHDWVKYLPSVTRIKDRQDSNELQRKRKLTLAEIERTFAKYSNWETRDTALAYEIKTFESGSAKGSQGANEDEDESILSVPFEQMLRARYAERAQRYGFCFRLRLGNGFDLVSNPYLLHRASIQPSV